MWYTQGSGPDGFQSVWIYRMISFPSTPLITSVRRCTFAIGGRSADSAANTPSMPASLFATYASLSGKGESACSGADGGVLSKPKGAIAAINRGSARGSVFKVLVGSPRRPGKRGSSLRLCVEVGIVLLLSSFTNTCDTKRKWTR